MKKHTTITQVHKIIREWPRRRTQPHIWGDLERFKTDRGHAKKVTVRLVGTSDGTNKVTEPRINATEAKEKTEQITQNNKPHFNIG